MPIVVDVDVMLARRKMSVGALAERVGITPANLAVLKNGRAKAVRFTTLEALCEALECQPETCCVGSPAIPPHPPLGGEQVHLPAVNRLCTRGSADTRMEGSAARAHTRAGARGGEP
jgi:putative transcriptional regulator